jgi:FtsH-binding integral membrane protein
MLRISLFKSVVASGRRGFSSSFPHRKEVIDSFIAPEVYSRRNQGILIGGAVLGAGALYFVAPSSEPVEVSEIDRMARKRIKSAYGYLLGGLAITSVSSAALYKLKFPVVIARANPWMYLGVSLATSLSLMLGTMIVPYRKKPVLKHAVWGAFNVAMSASLCCLGVVGGPLLCQSALATGCMVGGLSLVAAKAQPGHFETLQGPVGVGMGLIVAAGLGNVLFPMALFKNFLLYGGLAVYSGSLLKDASSVYDTAQRVAVFDPINMSLALFMDTLAVFVHIVDIVDDPTEQK